MVTSPYDGELFRPLLAGALVGVAALYGGEGLAAVGAVECKFDAHLVCGGTAGSGKATWKLADDCVPVHGAVLWSKVADERRAFEVLVTLDDSVDHILASWALLCKDLAIAGLPMVSEF
jgi:hypothetical protein